MRDGADSEPALLPARRQQSDERADDTEDALGMNGAQHRQRAFKYKRSKYESSLPLHLPHRHNAHLPALNLVTAFVPSLCMVGGSATGVQWEGRDGRTRWRAWKALQGG